LVGNCFERLGFKNFDSGFYFRRVDLNFYQNPKKVKFEAVLKTSTNSTLLSPRQILLPRFKFRLVYRVAPIEPNGV